MTLAAMSVISLSDDCPPRRSRGQKGNIMMNINLKTRTIKLSRREVIDLLLMLDTNYESGRWNALHDKIKEQLDIQDSKDNDFPAP